MSNSDSRKHGQDQEETKDNPAELNAENAPHNLEFDDNEAEELADTPPKRDQAEADFAAEAHGFTGFERAGKGSRYKGSKK